MAGGQVALRLDPAAQLDGIERHRLGQFVQRAVQREGADGLAGRPHEGVGQHVQDVPHPPVRADVERGCHRYQREGVARPVAHFLIGRSRREGQRRQLHGGDQLVGLKFGLDVGPPARQTMQVHQLERAQAAASLQVDDRIECCQGHAHVRRMSGDAGRRCAEDGVNAVEAVQGVAASARGALVAARGLIVEVGAAGALQDVAAHRRHVADLPAGAG